MLSMTVTVALTLSAFAQIAGAQVSYDTSVDFSPPQPIVISELPAPTVSSASDSDIKSALPDTSAWDRSRAAGDSGSGARSRTGDKDDPIAETECAQKADTTKNICATASAMGMDPQQEMAVQVMTQQAMGLSSQMNASQGVAAGCQNQADLQTLMRNISMLKAGGCLTAMERCTSACSDDIDATSKKLETLSARIAQCRASTPCQWTGDDGKVVTPMSKASVDSLLVGPWQEEGKKLTYLKRRNAYCQQLGNNSVAMGMQGLSFAQGAMQSQACAKAASSSPFGSLGSTNGTIDCTNPALADVSPTCICQKDPNNQMCPTYKANLGTTGGLAGPTSGVGGAGAGNPYVTDPLADPGSRLDGQIPKVQSAKGNNEIAGGGGGGPGGSGMGAGRGGDEGAGGGGARGGSDKSAIVGLAGGGGGGAGGGLAKTSSSSGISGAVRGIMDKFNLKNFLPNRSDYKNRGIAGMSIPSADGITGPMGPSLFEKVSNQYQKQKTNLLDK
jgi:hypothetical protein